MTRDELILTHMAMVARIARKLSHILPEHLDLRDLIGAGYIGLVEAADAYRPERGPFDHFAYFRVRGAIIDANRRQAYREELNDSIDAWAETLAKRQEDRGGAGGELSKMHVMRDRSPLPDELAARRDMARALGQAMSELPRDEMIILHRHLEGERLRETAVAFGRSVGWTRAKLKTAREQGQATLRGQAAPARRRVFVETRAA